MILPEENVTVMAPLVAIPEKDHCSTQPQAYGSKISPVSVEDMQVPPDRV